MRFKRLHIVRPLTRFCWRLADPCPGSGKRLTPDLLPCLFVTVHSLYPDRGRSRIELDHPTCAARSRLEAVLLDAALALREVKCPPGRVSLRR